ncbi:MAG: hypothetical protein JKY46_10415 [Robiginitomaculum sp.]|nr:hypothetical protein [Robiginitomaculum sp.]
MTWLFRALPEAYGEKVYAVFHFTTNCHHPIHSGDLETKNWIPRTSRGMTMGGIVMNGGNHQPILVQKRARLDSGSVPGVTVMETKHIAVRHDN